MTQTAFTYANALYDLACEEGSREAWLSELHTVRDLMDAQPEYLQLLSSRAISGRERLDALDRCFAASLSPYLLNFLKILCEKDAIRAFPDCVRQYERRRREDEGIAEVTAVTAVPLSEAQATRLTEKLQTVLKKKILLSCRVDPAVLGGVRIHADGQELDGTVRRRLDELAKSLERMVL
ncbi:MAG: ATP synthase F1 subunit delta [Oscillospiraceae bacterium]|nr:ATP synthase F1 subunit delta [Oscillospiraceae bacterium]